MDSGYKHPLIVDLSCGTFMSELSSDMTDEESRRLTKKARDSQHAGTLKKRRRKKKKLTF
jgi:hypothetical protein